MKTAEEISCRPLDMEKLNKDINEDIHKWNNSPSHKFIPDNINYHIAHPRAIILEPRLAIIDEEFIGYDFEDGKVELQIHKEVKETNGWTSFSMYPVYTVIYSLNELQEYLLPETTLAEFTKKCRGYNSRIKSNEEEWMKILSV